MKKDKLHVNTSRALRMVQYCNSQLVNTNEYRIANVIFSHVSRYAYGEN